MSGFIYNGSSTKTVIPSSELILVGVGGTEEVMGGQREAENGQITITRPISNEYGTLGTRLTFTYSLIKENGHGFTDDEQRIVERWLTSPKFSQDLKVYDCDEEDYALYCGRFISTQWIPGPDGWTYVTFTFENNTMYQKRHYTEYYEIEESGTIVINCDSDELEEYVYPTLILENPDETKNVRLTFVTDNNNYLDMRLFRRLPVTVDCQHCILTDATQNTVIRFKDIGWTDVGNIYWPRLLPGENIIEVDGNLKVTVIYDCPHKKVGGWL